MPNESLIFHLYIGSLYLTLKIAAVKGQLQRFHKLSLFDRFRYVENGLDINF